MCLKVWEKPGIIQAGAEEVTRRALSEARCRFCSNGLEIGIYGAVLLRFALALAQCKFTSTPFAVQQARKSRSIFSAQKSYFQFSSLRMCGFF